MPALRIRMLIEYSIPVLRLGENEVYDGYASCPIVVFGHHTMVSMSYTYDEKGCVSCNKVAALSASAKSFGYRHCHRYPICRMC